VTENIKELVMSGLPQLPKAITNALQEGQVIPAHPLALDKNRRFDEARQRALSRYYLDAGCGGLAVGVHTTQFEIRDPGIGLYRPVLELAAEEIDHYVQKQKRPVIKIAGAIGRTRQAVQEAQIARELGYHAVLLSLAAFKDASNKTVLRHCQEVSQVMPLVGFYLQPSVGGRVLDRDFWQGFAEIENVVAIKIAPFNTYRTLDVMTGVAHSGRSKDIALYTGNDDHIVLDLMTPFAISTPSGKVNLRIVGGLLGHWAVWANSAVRMLEKIRRWRNGEAGLTQSLLALAAKVTDCNAAFFDVAHDFRGCIVGLHYVLQKQGILRSLNTLDPAITLQKSQKEAIDRVYRIYPELADDGFVEKNLNRWLS
jgi:dihydrodipicolinate synthase/N-acetylneuraminate lyase